MKERHLSDAKSWALDRSSLESQLANQRQEAAAAAAASLEIIDKLHAKVRSLIVKKLPRTIRFGARLGCLKSSGKLTRPFAQVQDMSGEIASLQPRACRDASEQTDAFEGKFSFFEFLNSFPLLCFYIFCQCLLASSNTCTSRFGVNVW